MPMPFSIESHIKKAKKRGYTVSQIKLALTTEHLWRKVINEGKPFPKVFDYYLELAKEGKIKTNASSDATGDLQVIYTQMKSRLF